MTKTIKKLGIFMGLLLLMVIGTPGTCKAAATPRLNVTSRTIYTKESFRLKLINKKKKVKWKTSNKKVAKVSSKGVVKGVSKGIATITAKSAKKKYRCTITVLNPYLDKNQDTLEVGKTVEMKLNGAIAAKYESSDSKVAKVSSKGIVTALKSGTTVIKVTDTKKRTYQCSIKVYSSNTGMVQTNVAKTGKSLNYYLYTPKNVTGNMPLIIYLHGRSARGNDLNTVIKSGGLPQYLSQSKLEIPAYVIVPQAPLSVDSWEELDSQLISLIQSVINTYPIDQKNISLTGYSMGGIGTWTIGYKHQELFARIAPISGQIKKTIAKNPAGVRLPVWSLVGSGSSDAAAYKDNNAFFEGLSKNNTNAKLTINEGAGHGDMIRIYLQYNIIDWLIGKYSF